MTMSDLHSQELRAFFMTLDNLSSLQLIARVVYALIRAHSSLHFKDSVEKEPSKQNIWYTWMEIMSLRIFTSLPFETQLG